MDIYPESVPGRSSHNSGFTSGLTFVRPRITRTRHPSGIVSVKICIVVGYSRLIKSGSALRGGCKRIQHGILAHGRQIEFGGGRGHEADVQSDGTRSMSRKAIRPSPPSVSTRITGLLRSWRDVRNAVTTRGPY